ncbi:putative Transcriptional adapter 1 [Daphnia magna]|uniref:Putative Transcriptional adapter 1 n=1 Tax=Daphnia magna TaxID=35525 RepID=A0A162RBP3_9CRUS|nr:putative Transcriptional adapter 1 [Daphnia magna]
MLVAAWDVGLDNGFPGWLSHPMCLPYLQTIQNAERGSTFWRQGKAIKLILVATKVFLREFIVAIATIRKGYPIRETKIFQLAEQAPCACRTPR